MTNIEDQFETEEWLAIRKKAGLRIEFANTRLGAAAVARADGKATLTGIGA
jgi:hypothetical protein